MTTNKERIKAQRIGTRTNNISGFEMECIEYRNSMDIDVRFLISGKVVKNVQWNNFIRGKVKDGYVNNSHYNRNYIYDKVHGVWSNMIKRCFDLQYKQQKPTYKDATCCEEWLSFENFCNWLYSQENYEIWKDLKWSAIDKDIVCKGNKLYSPETCFLVPVNVNNLFVKHDKLRGKYPIGVNKNGNKYEANCTNSLENRAVFLGMYDTVEGAFLAYKEYKENFIKKIAGSIPVRSLFIGELAQLGEHYPCKVGVKGSNPLFSISRTKMYLHKKHSGVEQSGSSLGS